MSSRIHMLWMCLFIFSVELSSKFPQACLSPCVQFADCLMFSGNFCFSCQIPTVDVDRDDTEASDTPSLDVSERVTAGRTEPRCWLYEFSQAVRSRAVHFVARQEQVRTCACSLHCKQLFLNFVLHVDVYPLLRARSMHFV